MSDQRRSRPYRYNRGRGGGGGWNNSQPSRQNYRGHLEPGMTGFLCTTNNQEKACVREALNLLNEYADILFGKEDWRGSSAEKPAEEEGAAGGGGEEEEEEDIAVTLQREVQDLQAAQRRPASQQRFRVLNSGAKNYVFISSTVADPVVMVHRLLTDLKESQQQRCRFLLRMLPVEATCRTNLEDITAAASKIFEKHFAKGNKSFAIIYKCRNNSGVSRDALIEALADLVKLKNATNYANLSHPQLAVLVEIVRNVCLMSVVPDYFELAKYNVIEVAAPPKEKQASTETAAADSQESEGEKTESVAAALPISCDYDAPLDLAAPPPPEAGSPKPAEVTPEVTPEVSDLPEEPKP